MTLGSIARDISVPAATPRMCASPQASCSGIGKLRWGSGQATGPRAVWMATVCNSGLSRGVGLLPGSLCRFGRDLELLRGGLLRLVRSCSCLLGSRSQIGGRPHWLGCTQCFAGVYAEGPAPAAASASHRERSRSAGAPCFELISLPSSSAHSAVPPRNRQFLRALRKRRSVCSLSEVACRMELSCAPKARIHVLQAPALMTTSLTPQKAANASAWRSGSAPRCVCVTAAASLVSSHLKECQIYIEIYRFLTHFALYKVLQAQFTP